MTEYTVGPAHTGARLDQFLSETSGLTRSAVQKYIEQGRVLVSGRPQAKNYRLSAGELVKLDLPEPEPVAAVPEKIELEYVYEDEDLLVVNKPKGMVVHPAPGHAQGTLVNALLYHCGGSLSGINGVIRPGIVHRIDKDTSGLLLVAKNDRAHLCLSEQIKAHSFERFYEAVVIGRMKECSGTVDAPIARNPADRKKMAVRADGREAVTHYRVLTQYDGFAHLRLQLETGRTHQIRVHMAHLGRPVLGDPVYGSGKNSFERQNASLLQGQCLHAKAIGFDHPDGRHLSFESELPAYFKTILSKLNAKRLAENADITKGEAFAPIGADSDSDSDSDS